MHRSVLAHYTDNYLQHTGLVDGLYYPPLWICQTTRRCQVYCLEHLPQQIAVAITNNYQQGNFITSFEIKPTDNEDPEAIDIEWWSDINELPHNKIPQQCSICQCIPKRIQLELQEFQIRFSKLRQDLQKWLEENCNEAERLYGEDYLKDHWDIEKLFGGLPY